MQMRAVAHTSLLEVVIIVLHWMPSVMDVSQPLHLVQVLANTIHSPRMHHSSWVMLEPMSTHSSSHYDLFLPHLYTLSGYPYYSSHKEPGKLIPDKKDLSQLATRYCPIQLLGSSPCPLPACPMQGLMITVVAEQMMQKSHRIMLKCLALKRYCSCRRMQSPESIGRWKY